MKERPILFSGPMVRAILEGRKTVTRRVIKPAPEMVTDRAAVPWEGASAVLLRLLEQSGRKCPYGRPGDRLWVRETFALLGNEDGCCIDWQENLIKGDERQAARIYRASCPPGDYGLNQIPAQADWKPDTEAMEYEGAWRPSIFMPRWASRILLEITAIHVERLQSITDEQAIAEGVDRPENIRDVDVWDGAERELFNAMNQPGDRFKRLWADINGAESWDANPWVWVVEFKRVEVAND
ncbi:morphogenetic protein [Ectopseudomonas composti]